VFERFTDRARKCMGLARENAQRLNHHYIGPEHFLLGCIEEGSGIAANVLKNQDVTYAACFKAVTEVVGESSTTVTMGHLPFTPRGKLVLEGASAAAQHMKLNYIGTEHLLLGVIGGPENRAVHALTKLNVDLGVIVAEIEEMMGVTLSDKKIKCGTCDDHACACPPQEKASVNFDDYQKFTRSMAVYPGAGTGNYDAMCYVALKGAGECGEFAEKLGKHMRKQGSINAISRDEMPPEFRLELAKELGDRLWYVAGAASELGYTLSEVAQINIDKLTSRKKRGVIVGEGDNR
jgi:ATP-dependent Clp protease ATP-binding subunit ClpA